MSHLALHTACVSGVSVIPVRLEVDIQPGLPVFSIIGLPDKGLEEARQRVRAAIRNAGFRFPLGRVTVNLSPVSLPKHGAWFDLAIALAILAAIGSAPRPEKDIWIFGELGLEAGVRPVPFLPAFLAEAAMRRRACLVPRQEDSALVGGVELLEVESLQEAVARLAAKTPFQVKHAMLARPPSHEAYAIDQVVGQDQAKRAIQIALAGGHHVLLSGPPGNGKTMLGTAAAQLLPPLERQAALEVVRAHALAGLPLRQPGRPSREPHHLLSPAALLGGAYGKPGELALAHQGVLFLDEFPLLPRETLEALREPMQNRAVRLVKRNAEYRYPAECVIIAAQNPCPCGRRGAEGPACHCTARDLARYRRAVSEPILDRFELFCEVPAAAVLGSAGELRGADMAKTIAGARARQQYRGCMNCRLSTAEAFSRLEGREEIARLLERATERFCLSARSLTAVVKAAITIADLELSDDLLPRHLQEALQYRRSPDYWI